MNSFQPPPAGGSLEIVCGPMFSGKSEELVRRLRRAEIASQKVQVFKPAIDDRFHKSDVVSRANVSINASPVKNPLEILKQLDDATRVVGIDEVQFFDETIFNVIVGMVKRGIRVVCSGLDQYATGDPFGAMPKLLCLADSVDKIKAVCTVCGQPASRTHRLILGEDPTAPVVADNDVFEARCRAHHTRKLEEERTPAFTSINEEEFR